MAAKVVKDVFPGSTFRLNADHYVGSNGIGHVYFKQTAGGLDIDNADFNVNINSDGSILSFGHSFSKTTGNHSSISKQIHRDGPQAAFKLASEQLRLPFSCDQAVATLGEDGSTYHIQNASEVMEQPQARLTYVRDVNETLRLAWRIESDILSNWLLTYVDAQTNSEILGVVDYSADATYEVFPWGVNDPGEGSREVLTDPWCQNASEFGWQSTGGEAYNWPQGNNAIAQNNPDGGDDYTANFRPIDAHADFQYPYSPLVGSPTDYTNASIVQLFYTANRYHDLLYSLGFTEVAGNFQSNNNGKGGVGNDAVVLNTLDGSGYNNANFATPPDGYPPRMRMYVWTAAEPDRDSSFDAGIVIHEYTHGLSTRLTGGPLNSGCLNTLEAGGMGEGWSDFMATAVRLQANDTRSSDYGVGAWSAAQPGGIRAYLYSTNVKINPLGYPDLNTMDEVHDIGTIWATMLYEVMWNLIDRYGITKAHDPVFESGVPTDGRYLAMKLVMDAMALQPCNPNFLQARDAIIDADIALTRGVNGCEIWSAFAKRKMGLSAKYDAKARTGADDLPEGVCGD
ncbi:Fungalysin metallopeptidase-like protein [Elsinoe fawcettii]|nr:Fungalysin metallopeptidase-like protein [Elsinoe fawcettii]